MHLQVLDSFELSEQISLGVRETMSVFPERPRRFSKGVLFSLLAHLLLAYCALRFGLAVERPREAQPLFVELVESRDTAESKTSTTLPSDLVNHSPVAAEKPKLVATMLRPAAKMKSSEHIVETSPLFSAAEASAAETKETIASVQVPKAALTTSWDVNEKPAYAEILLEHIKKFKEYPSAARKRGLEGTTLVRIELSSEGSLLDSTIANSGGFSLLDTAALNIVRKAVPYPAPPPSIAGSRFQFLLPITFRLR